MKNFKVNSIKKSFTVAGIVALASQGYIELHVTHFRISFAIILLTMFFFIFRELNVSITAILAGAAVYIWRIIMYALAGGMYSDVIWAYFPEIFFYSSYGILFELFKKKNPTLNINKLFISLIFCDYFANVTEIIIRGRTQFLNIHLDIMGTLILVALIRSSIAWVALNGLKYYRMLLLKEEHEQRYKKLLLMTSMLKTEMYWMEKNMHHIEKTMANAYELFEKISSGDEKESWANRAVTIAKDVHEIKKEYGLVVRGVEEITGNQLQDKGMYFKVIVSILKESMKKEIRHLGENIELDFITGKDFYTQKHYQLMSVFRNLIRNAIDAISESEESGKITFIHNENENEHIFCIKDNGCGIKEEDLKYIFSPGYSTKINYDTGQINRGLGLSLVKDIIEENLKGKIEVNSIEGMGSTFEIHILKEVLEENK